MLDLSGLRAMTPAVIEEWHWADIDQHFDVTGYLTPLEPPLDLLVSVRAIAMRGADVFIFESGDETHVIPGGRREPGEDPDATLIREIGEETGCAIVGTPRPLGVLHLHNLSPRRHDPDYDYPYPDTLQWVFVAEVIGDAIRSTDPFVDNGRFVPLAEARELLTSVAERVFLEAAANR